MAEETPKKKGQLTAAVLAGSALVFSSFAVGLPAAMADEEPEIAVTQDVEETTPEVAEDGTTPTPEETSEDKGEGVSDTETAQDTESVPEAPTGGPTEPSGEATATQIEQADNTPEIALDITEAEVGGTVTVSGTGFSAGNSLHITLQGVSEGTEDAALTSVVVEDNGEFSVAVQVPQVAPGEYNILVIDEASNSSHGYSFTVLEEGPGDDEDQENDLSLYLNPRSGPAGTTIDLGGSGFSENGIVSVSIVPVDGGDSVVSESIEADDGGWLDDNQITVPTDAANGLYDVLAVDAETEERTSALFNVTDTTLAISPETITEKDFRDSGVTHTVEGLAPGEVVEFRFGTSMSPIDYLQGEVTANDDGVAEYVAQGEGESVYIGNYGVTVVLSDSGAQTASGSFEVTSEFPQVSAHPEIPTDDGAVRTGGILYVSGYNVTADSTVTVDYGIEGVSEEQLETYSSGDFFTEFNVPYDTEPGVKTLTVTDDETGAVGTTEYTVTQGPQIQLSANTAYPGDEIAVSGAGFTPNAQLQISINPPLGDVTANDDGEFSTDVTIPADLEPGRYDITVENEADDVEEWALHTIEILDPDAQVVDPALTIDPERINLDEFIGDPEDGAGVTHIVQGMEPGTEISYVISGPEYVNDYESTADVDEDGVASFVIHGYDVADPAVYLGEYNTVVTYVDDAGETQTLSGSFTVVDGEGDSTGGGSDGDDDRGSSAPVDINGAGGLAQTGANGIQLGFLAGGLLLAGAAFVAFANRQRLFGRSA